MRWNASDFWRFWASEAGRRTAGTLVGVASVSGALLHIIPHGPLYEEYASIFQAYYEGFPVSLRPEVRELAEKVRDEVAASTSDNNVKFYVNCGFDPVTIGSTKTRFGATVGLPYNINYVSTEDINRVELNLNEKLFPSSSAEGKKVLETLILSKDAQKFLIARELEIAHSYRVWISAFSTAGIIFLVYLWSHKFNKHLNLFSRSWKWRATLYTILTAIALTIRMLLGDSYRNRLEMKADKFASELGPDFAAGGKEYLTKCLERNKMLRELLGDDGVKKYTPTGNEVALVRQQQPPLTHRLDVMQKIVEKWQEKNAVVSSKEANVP
ncbi:unnamed protein product [Notodromas monacha]|uniref:Transmembrane protein 177 n=1 Tax=Notodromas monacha TaxID=399045 RepID=A0A7R9G9U7_9CRUS|nr:unnamed protein product [Notodromas monacha]CAG0914662.1 unnamed protein product [Notodromas monacha]